MSETLFGDLSNPQPQPEVKIVKEVEEVFLVLDSTIEELLTEMSDDPLCKGITIFRSNGKWQVSGNMRDRKNWNCVAGANTIVEGLATLHQREKQMRAGSLVSPQYTVGSVLA